jgi:hypothetical protein
MSFINTIKIKRESASNNSKRLPQQQKAALKQSAPELIAFGGILKKIDNLANNNEKLKAILK